MKIIVTTEAAALPDELVMATLLQATTAELNAIILANEGLAQKLYHHFEAGDTEEWEEPEEGSSEETYLQMLYQEVPLFKVREHVYQLFGYQMLCTLVKINS